MSGHTPGPWHIAGLGIYSGEMDERGKYPRCRQVFPAYTDDPQDKAFSELQANARLIAAAPELLEQLKCAVWYWETYKHLAGPTEREELAEAQQAIRKAEGRA